MKKLELSLCVNGQESEYPFSVNAYESEYKYDESGNINESGTISSSVNLVLMLSYFEWVSVSCWIKGY